MLFILEKCPNNHDYKSMIIDDPIYKAKSMIKIRIYIDCLDTPPSVNNLPYIQFFYDLSGYNIKFNNFTLNKTGVEPTPQTPTVVKFGE